MGKFWVLMYVIVSWGDDGVRSYEPLTKIMSSQSECASVLLSMGRISEPNVSYVGVRCVGLERLPGSQAD